MGKRITHLYACGGGAINITKDLNDWTNQMGLSDLRISRLDTSDKNITNNMSQSSIFLLKGADGSGKQRDHNARPVLAAMDQILAKHQPEDYNIVVYTAGGGSGSVIGPLLVAELLKRKATVMAIVIGTIGDETQAANSVGTIKSMSSLQSAAKRPLIFSYFEVNQNHSQDDVDLSVRSLIQTLLNMHDSNNTIIDNKDIVNFYDWTPVRKEIPAQMACLEVLIGDELESISGTAPLGIASIYPDATRSFLPITPAYSTDGIRGPVPENSPYKDATVHYVISAAPVREVFDNLVKVHENIVNAQRAGNTSSVVLSDDDQVDGTGLVF